MYTLAHKFNIAELMKLCTSYLTAFLDCNNVVATLDLGVFYSDGHLKDKTVQYIARNLNKFCEDENFFDKLSPEAMKNILKAVAKIDVLDYWSV